MRKKEVISRANSNANKVIITVYVEKPRIHSSARIDLAAKAKPEEPQIRLRKSFNRRAELLAYARQLRQTHSMPKFKEGKSIENVFRRKKGEYKQIKSKQDSEIQQIGNKRKKRAQKSNFASNICRKLKRLLKGLSCGLGCNKGC